MAITSGVATKAGLGLGVLGAGATTVYFGGDYIINNSLSKYEKALIGFLNGGNDRDIVFEVKKGGTTDLTASDITFTTGNDETKVSVLAKVQISSTSNTAFKQSGNDATEGTNDIKGLNNNANWTWECELIFSKDKNVSETTIETSYKDRIFKDSDKGLLGILKKDFSNSSGETSGTPTKDQAKRAKIDFISQCGYQRGMSKNKEINGKNTLSNESSNNELKVSIPEFSFKKSGSDLVPTDDAHFGYWFKE